MTLNSSRHQDETALSARRFAEIDAITEEFSDASEMLSLPNDWDGDGSPAYRVETFIRASMFLLNHALTFRLIYGNVMPAPKMRKGPEGSIELHWRTSTRELLINIPAGSEEPADYYGDDGAGGNPLRGLLDLSTPDDRLMLWLTS